jgi:N4-gp56 family major capsid protein
MAVFDNINSTYDSGVAPSAIQDFYEKTLLRNAKKKLPHCRDLQKRTIPSHNGRRVQFRRFTPFSAITTPLKEGVTPDGQALAMTEIHATIKPYGAVVELTDEMNWALLDNVQKETATLLSDQALESIDKIAAEGLAMGTNVIYVDASNVTNTTRGAIEAADKLTFAAVKLAVRTLKRNNAPTFEDGYYHAIVDPDTIYDLTSDAQWTDVAKYQDKSKIETGELGMIYGVKFFEASTAHTFPAQSYLYGTTASLSLTAGTAASKSFTLAASSIDNTAGTRPASVAYYIREMTGKMVQVMDTDGGDGGADLYFPAVIDKIDFDGTNVVHTLRYIGSSTWEFGDGDKLYPAGTGASNYTVHSTIIYGKDFAGCIELDGTGKNVQVIINPPGSAGSADPLNQRGTVAWKVKGFCVTILQDAFGVRVEHGATA